MQENQTRLSTLFQLGRHRACTYLHMYFRPRAAMKYEPLSRRGGSRFVERNRDRINRSVVNHRAPSRPELLGLHLTSPAGEILLLRRCAEFFSSHGIFSSHEIPADLRLGQTALSHISNESVSRKHLRLQQSRISHHSVDGLTLRR